MLFLVPARPDGNIHPAAAHVVDGRHDLGQIAGLAVGDRGDEDAEADARRFAGQPGDDGPRIGGRLVGGARKALVVVGSIQRVEARRLRVLRNRELVGVRHALLGFDHENETHPRSPASGEGSP